MSHFKKITANKIFSRKLYAFALYDDHYLKCMTINKEKGVVYLRTGYYEQFPENRDVDLKSLSLEQRIPELDTRYGLCTDFVVTPTTINSDFRIDTIKISEVSKIKSKLDDLVIKHVQRVSMIETFPALPQGYTGWYELVKD